MWIKFSALCAHEDDRIGRQRIALAHINLVVMNHGIFGICHERFHQLQPNEALIMTNSSFGPHNLPKNRSNSFMPAEKWKLNDRKLPESRFIHIFSLLMLLLLVLCSNDDNRNEWKADFGFSFFRLILSQMQPKWHFCVPFVWLLNRVVQRIMFSPRSWYAIQFIAKNYGHPHTQ